ncbi:acyltransferase [Spirosoma sp.]|uniref:acyltransferase family protein n=1 Tax=Spirosoma sp. TaxID=1899569 RepID=UPI002631D8DD|nr:acyltransferase [Spirosoma sp.]MCX6218960.1 acyltransferase [Spirosoma sp.]
MKQNETSLAGKGYIASLDGFRGIAIMMVVISHWGLGHLIPGGFGVTLFFFISGFLITRLLIAEYETSGHIGLGSFYLRRVLRLYPALLVMVTLAIAFTMVMGCGFQLGEVLSTLFYYRNYYMIYHDIIPDNCNRIFNITWSLAVEEHFYLFFPLLFMALYRRINVLILIMVGIIVAAFALRMNIVLTQGITHESVARIYYLTDTRLDAIMFGCLMSLIMHIDRAGYFIRRASHPAVFIAAVALLFFSFLYRDPVFRETWRYSLQGLALCVILPATVYASSYQWLVRLLSTKWLVMVGKLSYSLYLFHWVGMSVAENLVGGPRLTAPWLLTAVPLGLVLSLLSYYYVEKPTAGLRKRFGSTVFDEPKKAEFTPKTKPVLTLE